MKKKMLLLMAVLCIGTAGYLAGSWHSADRGGTLSAAKPLSLTTDAYAASCASNCNTSVNSMITTCAKDCSLNYPARVKDIDSCTFGCENMRYYLTFCNGKVINSN